MIFRTIKVAADLAPKILNINSNGGSVEFLTTDQILNKFTNVSSSKKRVTILTMLEISVDHQSRSKHHRLLSYLTYIIAVSATRMDFS